MRFSLFLLLLLVSLSVHSRYGYVSRYASNEAQSGARFGFQMLQAKGVLLVSEPSFNVGSCAREQGLGGDNAGCNHGRVNVLNADTLSELAVLVAPDLSENAVYGTSIAASGDWLIVGAPGVSSGVSAAGAVYIYRWQLGSWEFQEKLLGGVAGSQFGAAVEIRGDLLAISAPKGGSGAVYLYRLSSGTWGLEETLTSPMTGTGYGTDIAVGSDVVVVGAPKQAAVPIEGGGEVTGAGRIYIYEKNGGVWALSVDMSHDSFGDRLLLEDAFGWRVYAADNALYAVAQRAKGRNAASSGVLYKLVKSPSGGWQITEAISPGVGKIGHSFGADLQFANGGMLVAASNPDACTTECGERLYLFEEESGRWVLKQTLRSHVDAGREGFAASVAFNGERMYVSSPIYLGQGGVSSYQFVDDLQLSATRVSQGARPGDGYEVELSVVNLSNIAAHDISLTGKVFSSDEVVLADGCSSTSVDVQRHFQCSAFSLGGGEQKKFIIRLQSQVGDGQKEVTFDFEIRSARENLDSLNIKKQVVLKVNNPPLIESVKIYGIDAPSGVVAQVFARDLDDNGQIQSYSIASGNVGGVFAIDRETGKITIANKANLEMRDYQLGLSVYDGLQASEKKLVTIAASSEEIASGGGAGGSGSLSAWGLFVLGLFGVWRIDLGVRLLRR